MLSQKSNAFVIAIKMNRLMYYKSNKAEIIIWNLFCKRNWFCFCCIQELILYGYTICDTPFLQQWTLLYSCYFIIFQFVCSVLFNFLSTGWIKFLLPLPGRRGEDIKFIKIKKWIFGYILPYKTLIWQMIKYNKQIMCCKIIALYIIR